jgi:hypothetical protein
MRIMRISVPLVWALVVALLLGIGVGAAYALSPSLTSSTALRNQIAYNWTFYQQGYYENNCLAYALGNQTSWIWPWGGSNPTVSQVDSYMSGQGYTAVPPSAVGPLNTTRAYAFGATSSVGHFAKNRNYTTVLRNDLTRAKWGRYEVFNHSNANPYKPLPGGYGPLVRGYVK